MTLGGFSASLSLGSSPYVLWTMSLPTICRWRSWQANIQDRRALPSPSKPRCRRGFFHHSHHNCSLHHLHYPCPLGKDLDFGANPLSSCCRRFACTPCVHTWCKCSSIPCRMSPRYDTRWWCGGQRRTCGHKRLSFAVVPPRAISRSVGSTDELASPNQYGRTYSSAYAIRIRVRFRILHETMLQPLQVHRLE